MKKIKNRIKRNISVFRIYARHQLKVLFAYPENFFIMLIVELGYSIAFILFFRVIMINNKGIGRWGADEMGLLLAINLFTSGIISGIFFVLNLRLLPSRIRTGDLDLYLVKPINSLFHLTLSNVYFPSLSANLLGLIVFVYTYFQADLSFSPIQIFAAFVSLISGLAIFYSVMVIGSSMSFVAQSSDSSIPRFVMNAQFHFAKNPRIIYQGLLKIVFSYIIPVVYIRSVTVESLVFGVEWDLIFSAVFLALLLLIITKLLWDKMIRNYCSASS